jgi:HEAT repeat protein
MVASGHSSDFSAFYESFFGDPYMAWHDGLDTEALERLQGVERDEAERLLIDALDSGDYRPAAGLAVLRSSGAMAKLKELLPTTSGDERIQVARALWHTETYAPAVDAVIDELQHYPFWGSRMNAAIALREMKTPAAVAALRQALHDPQDLVRHHAAASLLVMYGIQDASSWEDNPLTIDIMSEDKAKQEKAIAEVEKLLEEQGKIEMNAS